MARKPILSGPVLNREDVQSRLAGDDVMSRIIENDRERSGRRSAPPPPEKDALPQPEVTNLQERKKERNVERHEENNQDINTVAREERLVSDPQAEQEAGEPAGEMVAATPPTAASGVAGDREARLSRILEVAEQDEMIVVSVRVPRRLNDYVDQYVSRAPRKDPKRRYLKQDAMTEALAAFVADHPMPLPEELF